jgi:hypothetical protein
MDVEVIHGLTAVGLAVDHKPGAPFGTALFRGQFLGLEQKLPQEGAVPRVQLHNIPDVFFGDHQEMNRGLGGNIMEGQHTVILIDLFAGNLPGDDFTENTIVHNKKVYHEKRGKTTRGRRVEGGG